MLLEQNEKPRTKSRKFCSESLCYNHQSAKSDLCSGHRMQEPEDFARSLARSSQIQLLSIPFLGYLSTYLDDRVEGDLIDYKALDSLEERKLIEPIIIPENNHRWAYSLTELGRKTVVILRKSGKKVDAPVIVLKRSIPRIR